MKPLSTDLLTHLLLAVEPSPSGLSRIWDFLAIGGFVMLFIVLCSFAAVTVMISAWLRLRDHLVLPAPVVTELRSLSDYAAKGHIRPLQEVLERDPSLLARLASLAISGTFSSRQECVDTITARAKEELHHLERGVSVLEVMVTVAPLLGLLGTTAGLFVAVPSVLAHTYFVRRLDNIEVRLEAILHETIQTFFAHFEVHRVNDSAPPR